MARTLGQLVGLIALFPMTALAAAIDPATVTCKEYNSASHQGMVDINAALYKVTRNDEKLGALSEYELGNTVDEACAAKPNLMVLDALH
ncbi:hypothetical protein [Rhizobium grahamii]|uniref:Uncharacterized protein n=1 Tax=Rhizobium grahamii CCGE 502 TaxID=990285 RepID=S3HCZ5_9HYPH|nr:hypothetical protein [Rhizobium grahamii]EPE96564.1 hypothetical protein RGCCGE502_19390 [Rhizobium grahamii CCGE 502]